MTTEELFKFINATAFFPSRCPAITSWKHKLRGRNGRNNPVEMSYDDEDQIEKALEKLHKEYKARKKKPKN